MYIPTDIFKGELLIVSENNDCENNEVLQAFINKYEPIIFSCLLGEIYQDLLSHTIIQGDKYDLLLNGGNYTYEGKTYHFQGLNYIVACFIYFYYQREQSVITTQFGGKVHEFERGQAYSLSGKLIRNWNYGQKLLEGGCGCNTPNCTATLWQFLRHNDFDNVHPKFYEGGYIC